MFFALGVGIAYFVLPFAVVPARVLQPGLKPMKRLSYFDFVTTLFLAFGLVMEFPILLYGLSPRDRDVDRLPRVAPHGVLVIAIFAAVATPGGDLVSPIVLGGTMYILFELTIVFIRRSCAKGEPLAPRDGRAA